MCVRARAHARGAGERRERERGEHCGDLDDGTCADAAAPPDHRAGDAAVLFDDCPGSDDAILAHLARLREGDLLLLVHPRAKVLVGGVEEEVDVGHQRVAPAVDHVLAHQVVGVQAVDPPRVPGGGCVDVDLIAEDFGREDPCQPNSSLGFGVEGFRVQGASPTNVGGWQEKAALPTTSVHLTRTRAHTHVHARSHSLWW